MSFGPKDEPRNDPPAGDAERGPRGRVRRTGPWTSPLWVVLLVAGVLLLLVVGAVLLWLSYGDQAGGTSVFEDSVESGSEPAVRLSNEVGRVSIEGVEGLETVEISAKRYARGFSPSGARENADEVAIDVAQEEGSALEISSDGGLGTGVDYDLQVPPGSVVEVASATGAVEVSGLDGDVTVRAAGGDVAVSDVRASVTIEATRGDVSVGAINTETGNVEVQVGYGDATLEDLVIGILETRVEAGAVSLSGRFSGSGSVLVQTGDVDADLPPEDVQDLDLEARVGEVTRSGEQEQESG